MSPLPLTARRLRALLAAAAFACGACGPLATQAREAAPLAADPTLEAAVLRVAEELRCLVCQNETIAASQASLAVDLRQQIRTQLQQGRSDAQILDFMVDRYGQFVRYRPAFNAATALLWLGPFALLAVAGGVLWAQLRGRQRPGSETPQALSAAEAQRLAELLAPQGDRP